MTERSELLSKGRQVLASDPDLAGLRFSPFIRPDLTQAERDRDYELRQEVKRRRDAGENDIKISRGKIIKFHRGNTQGPLSGDGRRI